MPPDAATTTTTTATATMTTTMEAESSRNLFSPDTIRKETPGDYGDNVVNPSVDYEFDESHCLFCIQTSLDLDQNLIHMSKAHGLYIDQEKLLVDVGTLIAYFNLVILAYHKCLYCGTERNTRQAVQQHMMAKGHCKYDIETKDSELRDFFESSLSDAEKDFRQNLADIRFSDDPQLSSQTRGRKSQPLRRPDRQGLNNTAPSSDPAPRNAAPKSYADAESSSNATETPSDSARELSTRVLKHENMLNKQLATLRKDDRRSILHLPTSQQRALLATHHKQSEKARRTEQINQSNLGSAGNLFNCLSKTRLIRKPPHTGNVSSLKW